MGVVKANFVKPGQKGKSAKAMADYMGRDRKRERDQEPDRVPDRRDEREPAKEPKREPERKKEREYEPEQLPLFSAAVFGDRVDFVRAAENRGQNRTAYVHVVISPEHGDVYQDRDFEALVEPWIRDRGDDKPCPYYAVIHRNTEHHHMHLAAVRDLFLSRELERLKAETRQTMKQIERLRMGGVLRKGLDVLAPQNVRDEDDEDGRIEAAETCA